MRTITVNASKRYDILIEKGLLARCGELIADVKKPCTAAIVTDDIVDGFYGNIVAKSLNQAGFAVTKFVFVNGEKSKNIETYTQILDFFTQSNLTRTDIAIALGGGVVGDLTGFAAATYLRGIDFVQLPTTMLAAVDSSVGGKTGVDLPSGKNLVGAFHQPRLVLCDTATMDTLPDEVFADGVVEAIKSGIIGDRELFELLSEGKTRENIEQIIEAAVRVKAQIVESDEFESGDRRLLNLGHTFGHAIELLSNFGITHGAAVAQGMVIAAQIAQNLGLATDDITTKTKAALNANNIKFSCNYSAKQIAAAAMSDKKRQGQELVLVLPTAIGHCVQYKIKAEILESLIALCFNQGEED